MNPGQDLWLHFFDQLVDGTGTMDAYVAEFEPDHILLERRGELCIPTKVRVTTQTGLMRKSTTTDTTWSCDTPKLRMEGFFTIVEIDPDNAIQIDLNLNNNSARRSVNIPAWLGLTIRMLKSLHNQYWGGLPW